MTLPTNDKPQAGEPVPSQVDTTGQPQAGSETTTNGMTLEQALAKIAELNRENAKHRTEKKAAETAKEAAERQRLADDQKWKELYDKADADLKKALPVLEQHEAITAAFNASLDNRLKQIPDDVRKDLVEPVRATMSPVDFSNWLDRNMANGRLVARQAPDLDGGAGGSSGKLSPSLTAEQKQMAEFMGMTEKQYADQLQKIEKLRGDTPILGDKK